MSNPAQGAVGAETMTVRAEDPVTILYTNWRGETAVRRVVPGLSDGRRILLTQPFWFGESDWHKGADGRPEPQWFLRATDADPEQHEHRDFAMAGIKAWGQAAVDAALASPRADSDERTAGAVREALKELREAAADMLISLPAHWHDDATIRLTDAAADAETVLSAAAQDDLYDVATPAQPAGAVPDSLRALSEAATEGELDTGVTIDEWGDAILAGPTRRPIARFERQEDAEFFAAAASHVRTLLASHPAGQSAGSGADPREAAAAICDRQQEACTIAAGNCDCESDMEKAWALAADQLRYAARLIRETPAPDSTRTGQGEEYAQLARDLMDFHDALDGGVGNGAITIRCESETEQTRRNFRAVLREAAAALAARPAAPEAQGAEERPCVCPGEPHFDGVPCMECPGWVVARQDASPILERVRHVKRGTEYEVLGEAEAQVSGSDSRITESRDWLTDAVILEDGDKLMVYRGMDGRLWCRPTDEFRDGRFVPAPPASSGQGGR